MIDQEQRRKDLQSVRIGLKGEFWQVLLREMKALEKVEESYLDSFKTKGMKSEHQRDYNHACGRLEMIRQIIAMPEVIVKHNETLFKRMMDESKKTWNHYKTAYFGGTK